MAQPIKNKRQLRKIYKKRAYYFLLSFALILLLFQFVWGTVLNLTRYVVLNAQISQLEMIQEQAKEKNKLLNRQLKVYTTYKGIEELARNNLKMVGQDEVLVLMKNKNK